MSLDVLVPTTDGRTHVGALRHEHGRLVLEVDDQAVADRLRLDERWRSRVSDLALAGRTIEVRTRPAG